MKIVFIVGVFIITFIVSDWATDKFFAFIKKRIAKKREKKTDEFSTIPVEKLLEK